jgi:hypothetical protein
MTYTSRVPLGPTAWVYLSGRHQWSCIPLTRRSGRGDSGRTNSAGKPVGQRFGLLETRHQICRSGSVAANPYDKPSAGPTFLECMTRNVAIAQDDLVDHVAALNTAFGPIFLLGFPTITIHAMLVHKQPPAPPACIRPVWEMCFRILRR